MSTYLFLLIQLFFCINLNYINRIDLEINSDDPQRSIQVLTYNIRYDNPGDSLNSWQYRKNFVKSLIQFHKIDILCIQEGLYHQVSFLKDSLKIYDYSGVGRDDGKTKGEYSAIFYKSDRFKLLDNNTFWLSKTPLIPSKGWDAALPRIVSWIKLEDKPSGNLFFVFNTHFDHMGEIARKESAKLILEEIKKITGNYPVVLTGDFNSDENSDAYKVLTSNNSPLKDAFYISQLPHYGEINTFSEFDVRSTKLDEKIDYIFVDKSIKVIRHGTLTDFQNMHFPSDHLPVLAEIEFK